jgi:hypothetical protein
MATRTISVAGGNWNTTACWDEGVVPTSADAIVCRADGTSGSSTVSANLTVQSVNLRNGSGYSATLTISSGVTLTISLAAGFAYSDTMTTAGSGILLHSATQNVTAGAGVPVAWDIQTSNNVVVTLTGTMISANRWYYISGGGTTGAWNGGQVTIQNRIWVDGRVSGTTVFRIVGGGPTMTVRGSSTASRQLSAPITWDTGANNYTVDTTSLHVGGNTLTHVSGSAGNISLILAGTVTFSGATWSGNLPSVSGTTATSTLSFPAAAIDMVGKSITFANNVTISGATSLAMGGLVNTATATFAHGAIPVSFNGAVIPAQSFTMTFTGSATRTIASGGSLQMRGSSILTVQAGSTLFAAAGSSVLSTASIGTLAEIRSVTPGSRFNLNIDVGATNQYFANTLFADVNANGNPVWNYVRAVGNTATVTNSPGVTNFSNYQGPPAPAVISAGWIG